jgi:manganese-dependent inorganic pyrophosphatase
MTPTYIIGHKNPDADSICSAIAYAAFKEARGEHGYVAARCGNSNARIDTILARFHTPLPLYLSDVSPRVRDMMSMDIPTIPETATCADALELIDRDELRLLPVLDDHQRVSGTISLSQLGSLFIPRITDPRRMRQVHTSLNHIVSALQATPHHLADDADQCQHLFIRLGTMDFASFWKVSERENIPAAQSIIIVGDRRDIQQRAIEIGVRGIIVTASLEIDPEITDLAKKAGVNLISSPYDSATTAWAVRTASTLERVIDRNLAVIHPDARIADIRRRIATLPGHGYIVVDEHARFCGILTKGDVLKPVQTRLVLVDHNEMTQAVTGAEEVTITEIVDHHRLGALTTPQPILFINEPVGSTCTIIAEMFRRERLVPPADVAGLMMSGLISDTLHLNSPTTTPKDGEILLWLAAIAGVNSRQLAEAIFASGSIILAQPPDKVVRSDHKIYDEEGFRFSVSQVEELGFSNFKDKAGELSGALQQLLDSEKLNFAALLVTDINTQNSLLLVKGDQEVIKRINYSQVQNDEVFDLPGIVSRKKQLIPYFSSLLKEMTAG